MKSTYMFPRSPALSVEYGPNIEAKVSGNFFAGFIRDSYIAHDLLGKNGTMEGFAFRHCSQSQSERSENVFTLRYIFQVIDAIVGFYSVHMIYLKAHGFGSNKGNSNQSMHEYTFLPTQTRTNKPNPIVSKTVLTQLENIYASFFGVASRVVTTNTPEVRYFIQRPFGNRAPFFNAILEVIHDKFLLNRNWLWLEPFMCTTTCAARSILPQMGGGENNQ